MTKSRFLARVANAIVARPRLARAVYAVGGTRLMANLAYLIISKPENPAEVSVLCLEVDFFGRDLQALRRFATRIRWLSLSSVMSINIQNLWVPRKMRSQMNFRLHHDQDYAREAWSEGKTFFSHLLKKLADKNGVRAVVTPQVDWWEHEALRMACKDLDIPSIALSREYQITEFFKTYVKRYYSERNFTYTGDYIAMAGPNTDNYTEPGVARNEQISVVGYPRTDFYSGDSKPFELKKKVTLLSFGDPFNYAHLNFLDVILTFGWMSQLSQFAGYEFVVKCKNNRDVGWIKKYARAVPQRFEVVIGENVHQLLMDSRVVMGFGTTAVWEALLTDAALVVPYWYDTVPDAFSHGLNPGRVDLQSEIYFPQNAKEFRAVLEKLILAGQPEANMERRRELYRQAFFLPKDDTTCSETFENVVLEKIESHPKTDTSHDLFNYPPFEFLK
jgi:hypothetical protein